MGALARMFPFLGPAPRPPRAGRSLPADQLLRRVERIAISARKTATSRASGQYRAVFHGRGMEFSEVREYRAGDDVRDIDWNVTARAGSPYVKLYREERDRTLFLVMDLSASQDFGSGYATKRDLVAEAAAAIALSAVGNRDRVGGLIVTDRIESLHRPLRGRSHALAIVRDALSGTLRGYGTDLGLGLRAAQALLKSRAIVVVLSDFRDRGDGRELARLSRRHEVVAVSTFDPAERTAPAGGLFRLRDAESGERRVGDFSSPAFRRAWTASSRTAAERESRRSGADYLEISSRRAPAQALAEFFRRRGRR